MEFSQLPYVFIINYIKQFFNHEDFTKTIRFVCMQHLINLLWTPYDVRTHEMLIPVIIWRINLKVGMLVWFRCCLNFRHFPEFKKNYPFYPFLIPKFILFSLFECDFRLKLGQDLNFCEDRKRIKISEEWKNFVELVNSHYITVFGAKIAHNLIFQ